MGSFKEELIRQTTRAIGREESERARESSGGLMAVTTTEIGLPESTMAREKQAGRMV